MEFALCGEVLRIKLSRTITHISIQTVAGILSQLGCKTGNSQCGFSPEAHTQRKPLKLLEKSFLPSLKLLKEKRKKHEHQRLIIMQLII